MKKVLALVLCTLMLLGAAGASADTLTYDAASEVNGGKPITISFWVQTELEPMYTKFCDSYTALHPNVTFELTPASYEDHFTKLSMALANGTGPDMFHMHNSKTSLLVSNMKPYDPAVIDLDVLRANFAGVNECLVDGSLYYLGLGRMTAGIFYNSQLWREAGLTDADIPKTWDALREVAKKLTKYNADDSIAVCGFCINQQLEYLLQALNYQKGVPMFKKDSIEPLFNDTFKANLQWLIDLYKVDKVGAPEIADMSALAFVQGTAAMVYNWTWLPTVMPQYNPDMEYGYFNLPTWDGETPVAYDRNNMEVSPGLSKDISDEAYAVCNDFIRYILSNDELIVDFDLQFYLAPTKLSCAANERIVSDPVLSAVSAIQERTVYPGTYPDAYHEILRAKLYADILVNNVDIDTAIQNAYKEIMDLDEFAEKQFTSLEGAYTYADGFTYE